jgi:hypothetical protein
MKLFSRVALAAIGAFLIGDQEATADISQNAFVEQDTLGTATTLQIGGASTNDGGSGIITNDILAQIPAIGVEPTSVTALAYASVGRFGSVGLSAENFGPGTTTEARVEISNNEYFNGTNLPQHVTQRVIVDGGRMQFTEPARNSEISFLYGTERIDPRTGNVIDLFEEQGDLTSDNNKVVSFKHSGTIDLGATFDPGTDTVTIPLSVQTFDLGLLPPMTSMELDYGFSFHLQLSGLGQEIAEFSDPFHLSAHPALGTITLQGAAVPEPSTLALGVVGALGLLGRRRRAKRT